MSLNQPSYASPNLVPATLTQHPHLCQFRLTVPDVIDESTATTVANITPTDFHSLRTTFAYCTSHIQKTLRRL